MAQLSDSIEKFIKDLMDEDLQIEVRRNELAQHFNCAPSQINYVLSTRFTIDHGYIIESRRGGGGFIRIMRMHEDGSEALLTAILERIGTSISEENASAILQHLLLSNIITKDEMLLMHAGTTKNSLALPVNAKDILRASVLKAMVIQAFRNAEVRK